MGWCATTAATIPTSTSAAAITTDLLEAILDEGLALVVCRLHDVLHGPSVDGPQLTLYRFHPDAGICACVIAVTCSSDLNGGSNSSRAVIVVGSSSSCHVIGLE